MKFITRGVAAILTFTISLLLIGAAVATLFDDKSVDHPLLRGTSRANDSGEIVVTFGHEGYPTIINSSEALEVLGLAKSQGRCQLSLQNKSDKNVAAYVLLSDRDRYEQRIEIREAGYRNRRTVIAAGEIYVEKHLLPGIDAKHSSLCIDTIVFEDESFEGDINFAAEIVAHREGIRLQSVPVLQLIDRTLAVDDARLLDAFFELERQLGIMPEAISKVSALELLRSKYPFFGKRMIDSLYEHLKIGLYEGKNMGHSSVGHIYHPMKILSDEAKNEKRAELVKSIRKALHEAKVDFGRLSRRR
jgi:hypothetical protein